MSAWIDELSFAQRQRLRFIETMLMWDGYVQRGEVCKVFDVTPNHLTRDIKRYRTYHKDALEYDVERRAYCRGRRFKPLFASNSAEEYLALLQAYSISHSTTVLPALGCIVNAECVPQSAGAINPEMLRAIMHALKNQAGVRVSYQSFSDPEPVERVLWPHTLVYTGERWHARAFDGRHSEFRDFVLTRCISATAQMESSPQPASGDRLWQEHEIIEVAPAQSLSSSQKAVVAREYGMHLRETGELVWSTQLRKCLVGYFLSRYRLDFGGNLGPMSGPGQHPYLVLKNPALAEEYRFSRDW